MAKDKVCSICASGDGRNVVDLLLQRQVSMKEIAAQTGFSKSAIGRHSLRCLLRDAAKKVKSRKFDPGSQRIVVEWPDGSLFVQFDPAFPQRPGQPQVSIARSELRDSDLIVNVMMETAVDPRAVASPDSLTDDPPTLAQ